MIVLNCSVFPQIITNYMMTKDVVEWQIWNYHPCNNISSNPASINTYSCKSKAFSYLFKEAIFMFFFLTFICICLIFSKNAFFKKNCRLESKIEGDKLTGDCTKL